MRKLLYAKTKLFSKVRVPLVGLSLSASATDPSAADGAESDSRAVHLARGVSVGGGW